MSDPANSAQADPANSDGVVALVNADGSFVENWTDQFDETDRPTLERFTETGLKSLGKSYVDLQRQFRSPDDYVKVPKEDSSDEERMAFHRRLGVPETTEGYKYERSAELSDNIEIEDDKLKAYYQLAKDANLTNEQFNKIANGHLALIDKDIAAFNLAQKEDNEKANDEAETALKKKFGKSYDERVKRANNIMLHYGGVDAVAELGLENNPLMVEFIDNIAEDMAEDRIKGIMKTTVPTTAALDNRIMELRNHPAYTDRSHPQHKEINAQIQDLYKKKYPA